MLFSIKERLPRATYEMLLLCLSSSGVCGAIRTAVMFNTGVMKCQGNENCYLVMNCLEGYEIQDGGFFYSICKQKIW